MTHEHRIEMYPLKCRVLEVAEVEHVTPRMIRIHLGVRHRGFAQRPLRRPRQAVVPNEKGEHVLPIVEDDRCLNFRADGVIFRDYTVRYLDTETGRLSVDFVAHDHGPAGRWATNAEPGQKLGVLGPGGTVSITGEFDYHVLLVDETALPAAARYVEELPADAKVFAFLEVADAAEEQKLRAPDGARLTWLHRGHRRGRWRPGACHQPGAGVRRFRRSLDTWNGSLVRSL